VAHYGPAVTTWEMVPGLIVVGLGMGGVIAPLADIMLAGVDKQHAGSASGVFNTGIQLGASVGVALIGVIFFGLLGSQSGPAASAVTPQLRSGLAAAGVPAATAAQIRVQFQACLHDRLVAADPTVTPASCKLGGPGGTAQVVPAPVHRLLAAVAGTAVRHDFTATLERTLWFQVGVFVLSFALMTALPRGAGRRQAAPEPPADRLVPAGEQH
jgi:hypothetical protein